MANLKIPAATYRLQFNSKFRFNDALNLVTYLAALCISDLYASPVFQARKGSVHGYDVTDPTRLNPELGSEQDFESLVASLREHGLGLLQDFAPNHMAASPDNPWWMDVLENGPSSPYVLYFDVNWQRAGPLSAEKKVLLPVLGSPYGTVLENQELSLSLDEHGFWVNYYETRFPLGPRTCKSILSHRMPALEEKLGADHPAFQQLVRLVEVIEQLPPRTITSPEELKIRLGGKETVKLRLWRVYQAHPEIKDFVDENIRIFNGRKGEPRSFDLLDQLLDAQPYRLAYWRVAADRVAYRRFFDISDLVSIHPEVPQVFLAVHSMVLRLVAEGKVTGLRIDHIDGLYDPQGYLTHLQSQIASPASNEAPEPEQSHGFYIIAEKILMDGEKLPRGWPVYGTTGYDFASQLNQVMVDPDGLRELDHFYAKTTGMQTDFAETVYRKKRQVTDELFSGEIRALARRLIEIAEIDRHARDLHPDGLSHALIEIIACFPVYRTYIRGGEISEVDRSYIEDSIREARRRNPEISAEVFDYLRHVLLLEGPPTLTARQREAWVRFVARTQQFTGPIMAKGLEDTASYVYNRLISLNEVGGGSRAISIEEFHSRNQSRAADWPHTLNATSTHDTKRSEDVRARINILSEMPKSWARHVGNWRRWNAPLVSHVHGQITPDLNEELLLYQTLLGAWPLEEPEIASFSERIKSYMIKAMREAKVYTGWTSPDDEHEQAVLRFVDALLTPSEQNRFLPDFLKLQKRVAYHGAMASLSQVLLKITSPGIPDFYQGTEIWDLSLVDPDNRRPVDFAGRRRMLNELIRSDGRKRLISELLAAWRDGRIKLYLTWKSLAFRRAEPELFLNGKYLPLATSGDKGRVICFARCAGNRWAIVAVPRLTASLSRGEQPPVGRRVWAESSLALPKSAPSRWKNVLTGDELDVLGEPGTPTLPLADVFHRFPVALLSGATDGILLRQ